MNVSEKIDAPVSTLLGDGLDFNDLTSRHIGTLRGLSEGRVNFEDVSERVLEMLETLQVMGLTDKNNQLTTSGTKAIELAELLGGSRERRRAATMDDVEVDADDIYVEDNEYTRSDDIADINSIYQVQI